MNYRGILKMSKYLATALKIDELAYSLGNWAIDEKRPIESFTDDEILSEAEYVLSCFYEERHVNNESLIGDDGPEQKNWAICEVKKLKKLIKIIKYGFNYFST